MPSSKQRLEVWKGLRKKTSGGLTKEHLTKNKRGKIVSKKKSGQAFAQNNLGSFLREKGKKVAKADILRKKGKPPSEEPKPKKPAVKPKAKAAPKPSPKPAAPKKAPAKPAKPKAKPKAAAKKPAAKKKRKINPLTQQPYAKKSGDYVADAKVHADNIKLKKRKDKSTKKWVPTAEQEADAWDALLF